MFFPTLQNVFSEKIISVKDDFGCSSTTNVDFKSPFADTNNVNGNRVKFVGLTELQPPIAEYL